MLRSAIAKEVQPGQSATQAMYPFNIANADGNPLEGANRYTLRFEKGQTPPVDAFWSVVLYDRNGFPIENPISRTQIGTYDELRLDEDGSITIYLQKDSPGANKESSWMPAPEGPFNLTLRLYNPQSSAKTLDWVPPPVVKAK
ncbi:MAG: DUF1214 domain-containing protein [Pseudomonadota bacterium]